MELIFGTHNNHKVKEIQLLLPDYVTVKSLRDLDFNDEIEETGSTIRDNAFIKASEVYRVYRKPTLAEDTGLEVHALEMKPGVHTARFAGEEKDPEKNMDLMLESMKDHKKRDAQFRTVICFIEGGRTHYFKGILKGRIAYERAGNQGFGYDPIFIPNGYKQTLAELGADVKKDISHRSVAFKKFLDFLMQRDG